MTGDVSKGKTVVVAASLALVAGLLVGVVGASAMSGPAAPSHAHFTIVAYHWGFAFYDESGNEVPNIEVAQGTQVTLSVVAASALSHENHEAFEERTMELMADNPDYGGLSEMEIMENMEEAEGQGLVDHNVHIEAFGVDMVASHISAVPTRATFTADQTGTFDIVCLSNFCGWGHVYMKAAGGLVVT